MKEKILKLLSERDRVFLTELKYLLPEISGEYSFYMPLLDGLNPNILWVANVSEEFNRALFDLINDKKIQWKVKSFYELLFEGGDIYDLPIATLKMTKTKKHCWLPIEISLSKDN